jgi:hypothetical protein
MYSLLSCNTDPDAWGLGDAHEWNPERWLASLPGSVQEAHVPGVYSHLWVVQPIHRMRMDILAKITLSSSIE